jgi:hypothetical protein
MRPVYLFITLFVFLLPAIAGCSSSITNTAKPSFSPAASSTIEKTQVFMIEWLPDGIIKTGEYSSSNTWENYSISWRSDDKYLYIGMTAKTNGWVSMALASSSGMKNADMLLGFVTDGKAEIKDLYCTDNLGTHPEDTTIGGSYDVMASGGREEGGFTTIEFKRLLNTGDSRDVPFQPGVNNILWSYSSGDSLGLKHTSRGTGEIGP